MIPEALLAALPGDKLKRNEPLREYTSFRTGGPAEALLEVDSLPLLTDCLNLLKQSGTPWFLLGRGTNLLISDEGFPGLILKLGGEFEQLSIAENCITAGAAVSLSSLCSFAASHGLSGLEFAGGIPGSVGGGIVMNAGAYGGELGQITRSVSVLKEGELIRLSREEMEFSYRTSLAKKQEMVVLSAEFVLSPDTPEHIRESMRELAQKRREKQPLEYPSAGSTFKRPEGCFAGKLIQDAGLSGLSEGGAQVSEKHCGFIVNKGGATSLDIYTLIRRVQNKVSARFGVLLEPEVICLGEFPECPSAQR